MNLQGSQHVSGADAVHANVVFGPFNGKTRGKVAHSGLGCVVGSLGLGNIDDGTRHAADQDNAAGGLALDQMLGDTGGEEVGSVDVDAPKLPHPINGVGNSVEVLCETGRIDQVVDLAMLLDDFFEGCVHGVRIRNIAVVGSDLGQIFSVKGANRHHQQNDSNGCRILLATLTPSVRGFLPGNASGAPLPAVQHRALFRELARRQQLLAVQRALTVEINNGNIRPGRN